MLLRNLILREGHDIGAEMGRLRREIQEKCQPYLQAVQSGSHRVMYRGMKNVGNFYLYRTMQVRKDRQPTDSSQELHQLLDMAIESELGFKARSESLFVTNNHHVIADYGDPYVIFPIGDFKFAWSPYISDAYSELNYYPSFSEQTEFMTMFTTFLYDEGLITENTIQKGKGWLASSTSEKYYAAMTSFFKQYVGKIYRGDNLQAALGSQNEVMLGDLKEFIAVKLEDFYLEYNPTNFGSAVEEFIESCY